MKKRNLMLVLFITVVLVLTMIVSGNKIEASSSSDNGNSTYTVNSSKVSKSLGSYTTHTTDIGTTTKQDNEYLQKVNAFVQKQTKNSKVVVWAVGSKNDYSRMPISGIASNYESTHPGWKVLGGINADQYYQKIGNLGAAVDGSDYFYPQPYYPMIADGEAWFSITVTPYGAQNIAGFLQDGSSDSIISGSSNWNNGDIKLAGLYLTIKDDYNNKIAKYHIRNINETPKDGESSIWCGYYDQGEKEITYKLLDVAGNLFIVNAEKAYLSNSIEYTYKSSNNNQNAFFGKGKISYKTNSFKLNKGVFAIDTKDSNLEKALAVGTNVVVQFEYEKDFGEVESAVGYHTVQRMDNVDLPSSAPYNTSQYPRALFGRNASGDIVLITIDGKQPAKGLCGTSHDETNAVLKYYGCVEAYQMDGGGSVTAIVRNESNGFDIVNTPADGSVRSVFSALLVVEKKEEELDYFGFFQKSLKICALIKKQF